MLREEWVVPPCRVLPSSDTLRAFCGSWREVSPDTTAAQSRYTVRRMGQDRALTTETASSMIDGRRHGY